MNRVILIALSALSSWVTYAGDDFSLLYDDGYVDIYDSTRSVFTREMCEKERQAVSIPMSLNKNDAEKLKRLVAKVRFFSLPEEIQRNRRARQDGTESETITVCGPCAQSSLRITEAGKTKSVTWECDCEHPSKDPDELGPLLKGLRRILYKDPGVADLPRSQCGFY